MVGILIVKASVSDTSPFISHYKNPIIEPTREPIYYIEIIMKPITEPIIEPVTEPVIGTIGHIIWGLGQFTWFIGNITAYIGHIIGDLAVVWNVIVDGHVPGLMLGNIVYGFGAVGYNMGAVGFVMNAMGCVMSSIGYVLLAVDPLKDPTIVPTIVPTIEPYMEPLMKPFINPIIDPDIARMLMFMGYTIWDSAHAMGVVGVMGFHADIVQYDFGIAAHFIGIQGLILWSIGFVIEIIGRFM